MRLLLVVAIGEAIGGVSRFYLGAAVQQRVGLDFPAGTFLVNISGSLLLGFIVRYALQSGTISPEVRAMLTTGFCGGYTTFSTFSYEALVMLDDGRYGRAAAYIFGSVALSLVAVYAGFELAKRVIALRQPI